MKFSQLRKDQLRDLDHYTVMEWKDYMGKLEARKRQQGTSENLDRKISMHGSLFIQGRRLVQVPAGGRRLPGASKHVWRI